MSVLHAQGGVQGFVGFVSLLYSSNSFTVSRAKGAKRPPPIPPNPLAGRYPTLPKRIPAALPGSLGGIHYLVTPSGRRIRFQD